VAEGGDRRRHHVLRLEGIHTFWFKEQQET
jgi:hypothetical protein